MKQRKLLLLASVFSAITALVGVAVFFILPQFNCTDITNCRHFDCNDKKLWNKSRQQVDNPRHFLYPKLKQCLRIGMTRSEVRRLTGEPDFIEIHSDAFGMGMPPFGIDYGMLEFRYDENDRLIDYQYIQG